MKKTISLLLSGLLAAGALASVAATPAELPQTLEVTASTLRVREDSTTDSGVAGRVHDGDLLTVLGKDGNWYKIRTESGLEGYVYKNYVTAAENAEDVVDDEDIPEDEDIPDEEDVPEDETAPDGEEDTEIDVGAEEGMSFAFTIDGKALAFELDANATTGYSWSYELSKEGILKETEDRYAEDENPEGMEGVGGVQHYGFEAAAPGTVTLTFTYARPWESSQPAEALSYEVVVDEDLHLTCTELPQQAENSLTFDFEANATTGYSWSYALSEEGVLELLSDSYVEDEHEEGMEGVGGTQHYAFKAAAPGTVTLTFTYAQPWEGGDTAEVRAYTVTVGEDLAVTCTEQAEG